MQYEHDPPVHFAYNEEEPDLRWELSHARLSAFLDALAYVHAFAGGAVHGGVSHQAPDNKMRSFIRQHWTEVRLESHQWGREYPAGAGAGQRPRAPATRSRAMARPMGCPVRAS